MAKAAFTLVIAVEAGIANASHVLSPCLNPHSRYFWICSGFSAAGYIPRKLTVRVGNLFGCGLFTARKLIG